MRILRCFRAGEGHLGVVEIAERTGLHKSSISRQLQTLESEGLVERDPASLKYSLGLGLLSVAGTLLADLDVRRAAYPLLGELASATRESCSLVFWSEGQAVIVEQVTCPEPIRHSTAIGTRYDTTASSSVLVFLAARENVEVSQLVENGRVTLQGHASSAELLEELDRIRRDGIAINDGRTDSAEWGVCAPVRDHRADVVAGLLVSAPRFRVTPGRAKELSADCTTSAQRISRSLGHC